MNFLLPLLCCFTISENLTSVTKPYLTTYTCKYMVLGEENLLDDFKRVTIQLTKENYICRLETNESKREQTGGYTYDEQSGQITLEGVSGYLVGNELTFGKQFGDKYFFAKFVGTP